MYPTRQFWIVLGSFIAAQWLVAPASAQHFDVLVQAVDGKLTTGAADIDSESFTLGLRVWSRFLSSSFVSSHPGFNAVSTATGSLPPGSSALPGNADLFWDFVPMKVGAVTSNLLYWNGAGTTPADVSFGPPPTSEFSLSLFGVNNARAAADGSDQLVPGQSIDTTASDGFLHIHRPFFLDNDHDDGNATVAPDGVYLVAMRLRMDGLNRSDPYYIAFGTSGATTVALQAAATWVTDRVDQLAPNFDSDFDGDLDVDGADFLTWQRGLGLAPNALQINGDADRDGVVGAGDLAVWQEEFGLSLETLPGAQSLPPTSMATHAVPEPSALALAACGIAVLLKAAGSAGGRTDK
jgi:hypothetical protein